MNLLQPKFPNSAGGRYISFLRVITDSKSSFVVKVTNQSRKEGELMAECTVEKKFPGGDYMFNTYPEDIGHRALCRLLCSKGVRGNYVEWLEAVEDNDESLAEEKRGHSVICFLCVPVGEKEASEWKFKVKIK